MDIICTVQCVVIFIEYEVMVHYTLCLFFSLGAVIVLGKSHKFRFNHPAEAAVLRQRRSVSFKLYHRKNDPFTWYATEYDTDYIFQMYVYLDDIIQCNTLRRLH